MSQQHERYITAREVAERVGLTPGTIVRYFNEGLLPGRRLPGKMRPVRFLWSEVEAAWGGLAEQAADQARQSWADRLGGRAA
jgi:predicted DNA-binding transcriptional regulator AlpA